MYDAYVVGPYSEQIPRVRWEYTGMMWMQSEVDTPPQRRIFLTYTATVKRSMHWLVVVRFIPSSRDAEAAAVPLVSCACGQVAIRGWEADLGLDKRCGHKARIEQSARRNSVLEAIQRRNIRWVEECAFAAYRCRWWQ